MPPVLREPQDPEGNRGAKTQSKTSYQLSAVSYQPRKGNRQAQSAGELPEINRRFTQMDTGRNPFKNITAEAQRAQRIKFMFVGRRRQTKTFLKLECRFLPNRRLPIGQKEFLSVLCVSAVKCPNPYLRVSAKICG